VTLVTSTPCDTAAAQALTIFGIPRPFLPLRLLQLPPVLLLLPSRHRYNLSHCGVFTDCLQACSASEPSAVLLLLAACSPNHSLSSLSLLLCTATWPALMSHALAIACQAGNVLGKGWHSCMCHPSLLLCQTQCASLLRLQCSTVGLKPGVKLPGDLWQQQKQQKRKQQQQQQSPPVGHLNI